MVCKKMEKFLNRKATIFKSAKHLSTLCDIPVLLILYGPDMPNQPQSWCSESDYGTVIDKYYGTTKRGNRSKVKKVGDDQFLGNLSLDELKDLNGVLAEKIECVKQRIEGLKMGEECDNSDESWDFECGFNGGLKLAELGYYENSNNLIDCGGISGFEEANLNHMNVEPSFNDLGDYVYGNLIDFSEKKHCFDEVNFEGMINPNMQVNDGLNVEDLGCEGIYVDDVAAFEFSNPMCTSSLYDCQDTELMIDISDLDDIKFVGDDLQLVNRLATVEDSAFMMELLCS